MKKVTISELKNRLSAYLRRVRAGEALLVLDRDEPVARIERVTGGAPADDRLARLERAGLLRRATDPVSPTALKPPAPAPGRSVLEALLDERRTAR